MHAFFKYLFLVYFVTHVPITLLIDLQGNWGQHYPQILQDLVAWYITHFKDFLMDSKPDWFRSFIICEALFQLPFFFSAIYALVYHKNWIRIPAIVYGAHVSTTLIPILAEFIASSSLSSTEKTYLCGIYSPYLLIPALLCLYMCLVPKPFPDSGSNTKKSK